MSPSSPPLVTRFAPSPTGLLHLGHAFSALTAFNEAREKGGRFLLRLEDIDGGRTRPEFEDAIYEDLAWLGLKWETPVRKQSEHMQAYADALSKLEAQGLLYPCTCTRKEINAEVEAAAAAPHGPPSGVDGPPYPGTCRKQKRARPTDDTPYALRLDMTAALKAARAGGERLEWRDDEKGLLTARPDAFGDVVLARKDTPTSYHLAVTLDDHTQGINRVVRGKDLFESTHIHRLLQALLGLETPTYHHHQLIMGEDGKRLAKRDASITLRALRESGQSAEAVRSRLGF